MQVIADLFCSRSRYVFVTELATGFRFDGGTHLAKANNLSYFPQAVKNYSIRVSAGSSTLSIVVVLFQVFEHPVQVG